MKRYKIVLLALIILLTSSCKVAKYQKQGTLVSQNFYKEIPFQYIQDLIIISVEIDSKKYNLALDTGAEVIALDKSIADQINFKSLSKSKVNTTTKTTRGILFAELPRIEIDGIQFDKTVTVFMDFSSLSDAIGCIDVHGLLGNNVMRKAHWQIDYQNQVIRITDDFSNLKYSKDAHRLKMNSGTHGNIYFDLKIAGVNTTCTFDTGYNGKFKINKTELLKNLNHKTIEGTLGANASGATIGKSNTALVKKLQVEDITVYDQIVEFRKGSSSLIGNGFWEHYNLTIDWKNDELIMEPKVEIEKDELFFFELTPSPDFTNGTVNIIRRISGNQNHSDIVLGTQILKINDYDVSHFSETDLCDFWNNKWKEIKKEDSLKMLILEDNKERLITVDKLFVEN